jgi:hypothetical protein
LFSNGSFGEKSAFWIAGRHFFQLAVFFSWKTDPSVDLCHRWYEASDFYPETGWAIRPVSIGDNSVKQ